MAAWPFAPARPTLLVIEPPSKPRSHKAKAGYPLSEFHPRDPLAYAAALLMENQRQCADW